MKVTNPATLLDLIDMTHVEAILDRRGKRDFLIDPAFVEPGARLTVHQTSGHEVSVSESILRETGQYKATTTPESQKAQVQSPIIQGKVVLLGDFIDTDALAPNEAISTPNITREQLGTYCLYHTHPDFRRQVRELGHNIVVAGEAFGCGSSREDAVGGLLGAGVQCVIAKSFAFIYSRNQSNLGLLGFEMKDPRFWEVVEDGREMRIDLDRSLLQVQVDDPGACEIFSFSLSPMQRRLMECGGAANAFGRWGKGLWEALTSQAPDHGIENKSIASDFRTLEVDKDQANLAW